MNQIPSLIAILRKKNLLSIAIIILLVVAIPLSIYLIRNPQILRSRATGNSTLAFFGTGVTPATATTPATTTSQTVGLRLTYAQSTVPSAPPSSPTPAPTLVPIVSNGCTLRGPSTLAANQSGAYSVLVSFPGPAYNSKPTNCNSAGTSCAWVISYQGSNLPPIPTVVDTFTFSENPPGSRPAGNYTLYFVHVNNATPQTPIAICSANVTVGTVQGVGAAADARATPTPTPTPTRVPGATPRSAATATPAPTRYIYINPTVPPTPTTRPAATATPVPTSTPRPSCLSGGSPCNINNQSACCSNQCSGRAGSATCSYPFR